jgi:hypothetical protein
MRFIFSLLLLLMPLKLLEAQQLGESQLDSVKLAEEEIELENILAKQSEVSLRQVLLQVTIVQDNSYDTSFVYDLYVDYDPTRYHSARVGIYPLKFEDQFVFWGKRIAIYTNQTSWESGRFYLHDVSTGKIAWIFTADTRRLHKKKPAQQHPSYTPLSDISKWLRFIRLKSHDGFIDFYLKKTLTIPSFLEKQLDR